MKDKKDSEDIFKNVELTKTDFFLYFTYNVVLVAFFVLVFT